MSDAVTAAPAPAVVASHISTAEWQSFEMRMRRRRAQRCLLRAEVALEAGFADDAGEALEEARRLDAPLDQISRVERLIAASQAAPTPELPVRLSWRAVAVAVLLMASATGFASHTLLRTTVADRAPAAVVSDGSRNPRPTAPVQNVPAASAGGLPRGTSGTGVPATSAPDRVVPERRDVTVAQPIVEALPPRRPEPDTAVAASSSIALPTRPMPGPSEAIVAAAPPLVAPSSMTADTAPAAPSIPDAPESVAPKVDPVPALAAAPPPRDETADVRAVLARYETAYTELDSSQARAVWPGVDERALSRAFSSLASQRVSLGRCDVTLNGGTARATCAGVATWTPKVGGGGARTEARRWVFDLSKSGEAWRIQRATVR